MRSLLHCVMASLALLAVAREGSAQTSIGIQPLASYYRPLGRFDAEDVYSTGLPQQPSDLRGVAWGGEVQLQLGHRFAVSVVGETTRHTLPSCVSCPGLFPTDAVPIRVSLATFSAQYDLSFRPERYHLWIGAGPAVVRHSGLGYGSPIAPVSWGATAAAELSMPMAPHWDAVAGGSAIRYHFDEVFPPQHGPQLDALLSVGVRWHTF